MVALPAFEWDKVDTSVYNLELFRKPWLLYESFLKSRGYTLSHPSSDAYAAIFRDRLRHIPTKAPQDPFHPRSDEAFWFIEPDVLPICAPDESGRLLYQTPSVHPALDPQGRRVILKALRSSSTELEIIQLLSTDPLRADPRNHTIPVVDILDLGEWAIIVTAEWKFGHQNPCASAGEYFEFARQLFEGLAFMHEHGIFHGDIHDLNIVMNHQGQRPTVLAGTHVPFARDFGPCGAKYAFIDFGESQIVHAGDVMRVPVDFRFCDDTGAPELLENGPVNVLSCDVYALGALLRKHVEETEYMFSRYPREFISITSVAPQYVEFIAAITHENPGERPTAAEAVTWLERLSLQAGHADSKTLDDTESQENASHRVQ